MWLISQINPPVKVLKHYFHGVQRNDTNFTGVAPKGNIKVLIIYLYVSSITQVKKKNKQVAQKGNNRSPEEQLAQSINLVQNSKRPLVELLKLLELKPKPVSA